MVPFVTLKVVTVPRRVPQVFRDASQDQGRPHPHEARAGDDAKEVLGRHVSLWWCFNRSRSWVLGAVHGS
jgi:hypothetical protein